MIGAATSAFAADTTAIMMSSEASSQGADSSSGGSTSSSSGSSGSGSGQAAGISRASLLDNETTRKLPFSLSDFSMLMGPGFQNFTASAPSRSQPYAGISARHELRMDIPMSRRVTLSPTMDMSETFYDTKQGRLVMNDPSLRVAISDVSYARLSKTTTYDAAVWASVYAPTSTVSQELNEYTAVSVAYLPKLTFRGSRFFLSGVTEAKANFIENQSQTGMLAPVQLVGAVQGNYRVSPKTTVFLMDHVNGGIGPSLWQMLTATPIGADNFRRKAQNASQGQSPVTDGIMVGSMFQVMQGISLSPRLDWTLSQNIGTTSIGLNASFHII
jgi:hypothetical protein